ASDFGMSCKIKVKKDEKVPVITICSISGSILSLYWNYGFYADSDDDDRSLNLQQRRWKQVDMLLSMF
ncbi:MAG: hypothetical protein II562_04560, partial [Prevotella sp.]|nr:hypothetical protein [Prevotella sp.]